MTRKPPAMTQNAFPDAPTPENGLGQGGPEFPPINADIRAQLARDAFMFRQIYGVNAAFSINVETVVRLCADIDRLEAQSKGLEERLRHCQDACENLMQDVADLEFGGKIF